MSSSFPFTSQAHIQSSKSELWVRWESATRSKNSLAGGLASPSQTDWWEITERMLKTHNSFPYCPPLAFLLRGCSNFRNCWPHTKQQISHRGCDPLSRATDNIYRTLLKCTHLFSPLYRICRERLLLLLLLLHRCRHQLWLLFSVVLNSKSQIRFLFCLFMCLSVYVADTVRYSPGSCPLDLWLTTLTFQSRRNKEEIEAKKKILINIRAGRVGPTKTMFYPVTTMNNKESNRRF